MTNPEEIVDNILEYSERSNRLVKYTRGKYKKDKLNKPVSYTPGNYTR